MTYVMKGFKPLTQMDVQRRLVSYPQLQQTGAFVKWLTAQPTLDATPRSEEKKECATVRASGFTPAVLFSRRLPPGRDNQSLLSVSTQRVHDLMRREGFTGRAYWLNVRSDPPRKVLVRPHQVQLNAASGGPSNISFCIVDEAENQQAVDAVVKLVEPAIGALSGMHGPKAKRD
jgi:hypothetical protein